MVPIQRTTSSKVSCYVLGTAVLPTCMPAFCSRCAVTALSLTQSGLLGGGKEDCRGGWNVSQIVQHGAIFAERAIFPSVGNNKTVAVTVAESEPSRDRGCFI